MDICPFSGPHHKRQEFAKGMSAAKLAQPNKHSTNALMMRFVGCFLFLIKYGKKPLTTHVPKNQQPDPSFANRIVCLLPLYKSLQKKFSDGSVEENRRGKGFC